MDPSEGDEAARDELLTKRVRGTAGGAWERDGDQLRDSLRHAWKLWIEGGKPPTGPQREFIERCLGLLCKDTVGKQSESLDLVAQFLVGLPSETAVELRNQLKGSAVLMLELQAPTAAARALFARAAERETDQVERDRQLDDAGGGCQVSRRRGHRRKEQVNRHAPQRRYRHQDGQTGADSVRERRM